MVSHYFIIFDLSENMPLNLDKYTLKCSVWLNQEQNIPFQTPEWLAIVWLMPNRWDPILCVLRVIELWLNCEINKAQGKKKVMMKYYYLIDLGRGVWKTIVRCDFAVCCHWLICRKSWWLEDFDFHEEKKGTNRNRVQDSIMGFSKDNLTGFILALLSTGFIGASFIIKKKGLRRAAAASGVRAGIELFFNFFLFNFFPVWWYSKFWYFFNCICLCSALGCFSFWLMQKFW